MKIIIFLVAAFMLYATSALAEVPGPETEAGLQFKMKALTVNVGGFLEGSAIYRSRNLDSDIASPFQSIPLGNSAGHYQDETRFTARHSRLTILARGDFSRTHLAGYYEADFLGAAPTANSNQSNSYNLRMRNLYATIDWDRIGLHLLAGQNWSLATMNGEGMVPRKEAIPLTIDSQYIPGFTWTRQPQFRIVKDWDKKYWLGLSVENPESTVKNGPNQPLNTNFANGQAPGNSFAVPMSVNAFPDFVVKAAADPGWGHFEIFDLIRVFESGLAAGGKVNTTFRVTNAVGAGVILPLVDKELKLYLSGMYGDGIGRYGAAQLPDMTQSELGENLPLESSKFLAGLAWEPAKEWQLYAYYGQEQVQQKSFVDFTTGKGYGYGSELYDNSGASVLGGTANGNIRKVWQVTSGAWWNFYQGDMGRMQAGLQYSYTEDEYFQVIKGGSVEANDNMVFTALRYYWE